MQLYEKSDCDVIIMKNKLILFEKKTRCIINVHINCGNSQINAHKICLGAIYQKNLWSLLIGIFIRVGNFRHHTRTQHEHARN